MGIRTPDLLRAKQALSQLSYCPIDIVVGVGGLEPPTSILSGSRSNQLSYTPEHHNARKYSMMSHECQIDFHDFECIIIKFLVIDNANDAEIRLCLDGCVVEVNGII